MEISPTLRLGHVTRALLLLFSCLPLGGTTGMVFTVFDVFADLESWGRVTVGRFNASSTSHGATGTGNGWPIPEVTSSNSQTMEITEIRLLDAKGKWVKSHIFDSSSRNFAVSNWERNVYDLHKGEAMRAHARRIETIRLGELNGQVNMAVYVATDSTTIRVTPNDAKVVNVSNGTDDIKNTTDDDVTRHDDVTDDVDDVINVQRGDVHLVLEFENVTEGCVGCVAMEVVVSFWGHHMTSPSSRDVTSSSGGRDVTSSTSGVVVKELRMHPANTRVWLPNTVLLDGNLTHLSPGSPSFKQGDSAVMVTLRMPIFGTSAVYSATLRVGGENKAHTLPETPQHKVYGEEQDGSHTTESFVEETTAEKGQQKGGSKKEQNVVQHPEYRHVKDGSEHAKSGSGFISFCHYLMTIVFTIAAIVFL